MLVGKFCPYCGEELPDNLPVSIDGIEHIPPEIIIENVLNEMGVNAIHARKGMNYWKFQFGSAKLEFAINQDGTILAESSLAKIPQKDIVNLYEFLLRENPELGTDIRFGTDQKHVTLSFNMNAVSLNEEHFIRTLKDIMSFADKYDDILIEKFACDLPDDESEFD